jgi:hypothetical protein
MLLTIREFLKNRKESGRLWPSKSRLHSMSFHNFLGFRDRVVRKLGDKLFIDEEEFEKWLRESAVKIGDNTEH